MAVVGRPSGRVALRSPPARKQFPGWVVARARLTLPTIGAQWYEVINGQNTAATL